MANTLVVCLLATLLCCIGLSHAHQIPAHCTKGPELWCQSLREAADCGAVQHCIGTVWENQITKVAIDDVSSKILNFFKEMKDVKDLINNEYLATRLNSICRMLPNTDKSGACYKNTVGLEAHVAHLLASKTSPQTMCRIVEVCGENEWKRESAAEPATVVKDATPIQQAIYSMPELLGAEKCTWGPSYWCNNFSTGRECKAMHHCLTRVWPSTKFPVDNDDICKICKDMVTQARDQLMSNETQTELKEVFEGSCELIPIKIVAKECMKLADEFVPELVETLSSQMNPNAVCSVAGLCNNARIDNLLQEYNDQVKHFKQCGGCKNTVSLIRYKFKSSSYQDFLVSLLKICRKMGSLSDSCSMLVFKYYENIREAILQDLKPQALCHISGQCTNLYSHSHDEYIFPADIESPNGNDVPCEFCEQLVTHLRDMLVANTTETEFYKVLRGFCKQSGKFQSECLSLAEQYYGLIYKYLTNDLQGSKVCSLIGICNTTDTYDNEPVAPLLATEVAVQVTPHTSRASETIIPLQSSRHSVNTPIHGVKIESTLSSVRPSLPSLPPMPIERMFLTMPESKTTCTFCQYLLHYLQVELSDVKNEDYIRESVMGACDKLPKAVNAECKQFVSEYGPAVIALLVQEIDPSTVCPALRVCPVERVQPVLSTKPSSQSNCPLCLFAVEQLETVLKNNKTEESIQKALDNLCSHLSTKMKTPCIQFVNTYSNALVELLLADLNAQEICVYLKICKDQDTLTDPLHLASPATSVAPKQSSDFVMSIDKFMENPTMQADFNKVKKSYEPTVTSHMATGGDIETNEIPDNTANGQIIDRNPQKTVCVVCEFVMKEIDDQIKDKHNEDEIKRVVRGVCNRMPKSVRSDCDQFVEKYADLLISLLAQELDPSQVCEELKLCPPSKNSLGAAKAEEILDCAVCETVVLAVKKVMKNDAVDRNIVHIVEKSCALLPSKFSNRCHTMMEIYGDSVIHLIEEFSSKQVCQKIGICSAYNAAFVNMYHQKVQQESPTTRV